MATLQGREGMLARVVAAIRPQVDRLFVRLNGYGSVPDFLATGQITTETGANTGNRAKYSMIGGFDGIVISIDDDIAYPGDYVDRLVRGLAEYGGRALVGFHGSTLGEEADFLDVSTIVPYWSDLERDQRCHVLGSGTIAWDSRYCKIDSSDFPFRNGIDVQLAVLGQQRAWPFVVLSRPANWMTPLWPADPDGVRRAGAASVWQHTLQDRPSVLNARPAQHWALRQVDRWVIHPVIHNTETPH